MSKGWVALNRKLSEHWLWSDKPYSKGQAWVDLILSANHKEKTIMIKGQKIIINRGQLARSQVTLASDWGWSRDKVRRFLTLLESDGMIRQQKNNITSMITICNYREFQDRPTADKTPNNTAEKHQTDTEQYTNNNVNKISTTTARGDLLFSMDLDWQPGETIADLARMRNLTNFNELHTPENLGEFVTYWMGQPKEFNQHTWEIKYIDQLKRMQSRGKSNDRGKRESHTERLAREAIEAQNATH